MALSAREVGTGMASDKTITAVDTDTTVGLDITDVTADDAALELPCSSRA
jgi:hypothetical protein